MTSSVTASRRSSLSDACGLNVLQPRAKKYWSNLETVAAGMRHGNPDLGNTNGTGACGLANKHQLRLGGLSFNAHTLPSVSLSPDMDVHRDVPVIFAQSPDLHGRGTGASAHAWLQMATASRSPIVQFVHPRTLRDGSYSRELSLIELLQKQDPEGQLYSINEISQSAEIESEEETQRSRRFIIRVAQQPFGNEIQADELHIDVTLYASKLDNGVMPELDIRSAGDTIKRMFAGSQKVAQAGAPILISYGGFGRSSCVGLYLSIAQLLRESPDMTCMQCLQCLDDLIIRGKSLRGAQFVPSFAQYQALRAAVQKHWIAHQQEGHGFFLDPLTAGNLFTEPAVTPPQANQYKHPPARQSVIPFSRSNSVFPVAAPPKLAPRMSTKVMLSPARPGSTTPTSNDSQSSRVSKPLHTPASPALAAPVAPAQPGPTGVSGIESRTNGSVLLHSLVAQSVNLASPALQLALPVQLSSAEARVDKFTGMMKLGAIGDALGRTTEFLSPSHRAVWIRWLTSNPEKWIPAVPPAQKAACRKWVERQRAHGGKSASGLVSAYVPIQFRLPDSPHMNAAGSTGGFMYERNKLYTLSDRKFEQLLNERFDEFRRHGTLEPFLLVSPTGRITGCPTDDTQQAALVLKGQIDSAAGKKNEPIAQKYARHFLEQSDLHNDTHWGFGSRQAAQKLADSRDAPETAWVSSSGEGCGNGSLMRIAPCLLPVLASAESLSGEQLQRWHSDILEIGHVTHKDPLCQAVNLAFLEVLSVFASINPEGKSAGEIANLAKTGLLARISHASPHAPKAEGAVVSGFINQRVKALVPAALLKTQYAYLDDSLSFIESRFSVHSHDSGGGIKGLVALGAGSKSAADRPKNVNIALEKISKFSSAKGDRGVGSRYLPSTVASVCYILDHFLDQPAQAMLQAVNFTSDNDTVAAIVGNTMGALYGAHALSGASSSQIERGCSVPADWFNGLSDRWNHPLNGNTEYLASERTSADSLSALLLESSRTISHQPLVKTVTGYRAAPALKECVHQLMTTQVNGIRDDGSRKVTNLGPYMPVNPSGIEELETHFELPDLMAERAATYKRDIIAGGFYGDALGSDLESTVPGQKISVLAGRGAQSDMLVTYLRNNLRRTHYRHGHHATDDTQQGILAALATRDWLDSLALLQQSDLPHSADHLAKQISDSFKYPQFPRANGHGQSVFPFKIRGGADTIRMIQDSSKASNVAWQDRCISKLDLRGNGVETVRAGGAGNGGIMRIAYDLIPHLGRREGVSGQTLIHHVLLSNQITHPSSFSAVASVGHVLALINCIKHREQGTKPSPDSFFFLNAYATVANALQYPRQNQSVPVTSSAGSTAPELSTFALQSFDRHPSTWAQLEADRMLMERSDGKRQTISNAEFSILRRDRLPSEILTGEKSGNVMDCGSVNFALQAFRHSNKGQEILQRVRTQTLTKGDLEHLNCIMGRWGSNAYLGATLPSIVFLLEVLGYSDPVQAIEVTAILTKDNDTCAAIIGQLMGVLHGTEWFEINSGSKHRPPTMNLNREALTHFGPYLAGDPKNGFFSIDEAIHWLGA